MSKPQIFVEPQTFETKISAGELQSGAISIKNLGFSNKNISIRSEYINWIIIDSKDITIYPEQSNIINFSINVPLDTTLGEYRGIINISYENFTIKEIPVKLTVLPRAQFQSIVNAPEKINKTDNFNVKINIKNMGESPVYGIKIRMNGNITELFLSQVEKEKYIDLLPKNAEFTTNWWFEANLTGWKIIAFDINSTNAGNQTIITKVKVE